MKKRKAEIIDHWRSEHGSRTGVATVIVVRAQAIVPFAPLLPMDTYVVVKSSSAEFTSPVALNDVNPEYNFRAYFTVEDDTRPIPITIMCHSLGFERFVGAVAINFRGAYENKTFEVSDEGVYFEKCAIIDNVYDSHGKPFPDTVITVKWILEVREQNMTVFCPECGRLDARCTCEESERAERHKREAQEVVLRMAAEKEAERLRLEEEHKKQAEREQRWQAHQEKVFKEGSAKLEGDVERARGSCTVEESTEWATMLCDHKDAVVSIQASAKRRMETAGYARTAAATMLENMNRLMAARFGTWVAFASDCRERRRTEAAQQLAAVAALSAATHASATEAQEAARLEDERKKKAEHEKQLAAKKREQEIEKASLGHRDGVVVGGHREPIENDSVSTPPREVDEDGIGRPVRIHDEETRKMTVTAIRAKEGEGGCCATM